MQLTPSAPSPLLVPAGMDIKQGLSVVAAVTLGKDMTFRDYAQGAFRMRGIGKGQKVQVRGAGRQGRSHNACLLRATIPRECDFLIYKAQKIRALSR